ncbi:MAG: porin family protein [Woeseiaceae bacterium]|nr:porin family protein [Woeseiaceae bacterium]
MKKALVSSIALLQAGFLGLSLTPTEARADSGLYIGGSAGGATLEADIGDIGIPGLPSSIDEDDTALKVFAGYNFDLPAIDLGIEAGFVDFGEVDLPVLGDELLVDTSGINLWGVASLDAGAFDIFGKVGYIMWDVEASFQGISDSDDGSDLGYGVGLRFNLASLEVRGEYELYDLDGTDLSMLSVGIAFHFN